MRTDQLSLKSHHSLWSLWKAGSSEVGLLADIVLFPLWRMTAPCVPNARGVCVRRRRRSLGVIITRSSTQTKVHQSEFTYTSYKLRQSDISTYEANLPPLPTPLPTHILCTRYASCSKSQCLEKLVLYKMSMLCTYDKRKGWPSRLTSLRGIALETIMGSGGW